MKAKLMLSFVVFSILNIFLYVFLIRFHTNVPFNQGRYFRSFHHYIDDTRLTQKIFFLPNALGQSDAQWYLKIADSGYPSNPQNINNSDKKTMDGLSYAFFPFYPLILAGVNQLVGNIEYTAFIVSNILLVINFFSLYFVVKRLSNVSVAIKTIFLCFFFPFSIFFRSYFTEGLMLFFLMWIAWFLIKKKYLTAAVLLGLLTITKANAILLIGYFMYLLWREFKKKNISVHYSAICIVCITVPMLVWMYFVWSQTGNPLYFLSVRSQWNSYVIPPINLIANLVTLVFLPYLPFHGFHFSQIDTVTIYVVLFILIQSRKTLAPELWWISAAVWITPLFMTDTMSFTRYQIISFPLFLYGALKIQNKYTFAGVMVLSYVCLLIVSLYFVNWYWIG